MSEKIISTNPNRGNYTIEKVVEAGLVLTGTEVKSIRQQSPNIRESYIEIDQRGSSVEAWLVNAHIAPYSHGNIWNHEPLQRRKLLLHAHQIEQLMGERTLKGMTLIPLRLYFKKGIVKVEVGVARGKKMHDHRQELKKRAVQREMDQEMRRRR